MKKTLLSAALALGAGTAMAQPTITAAQFDFMSEDTFKLWQHDENIVIEGGPAGANVTWDFSNLTPGDSVIATTFTCPGETNCSAFPGTNQGLKYQDEFTMLGAYYYNKTNSLLEIVGSYGLFSSVYSDRNTVLKFPVTYGQTFDDTYASAGGPLSSEGTTTTTVDGYGTLITPSGTYTDVLRLKVVSSGMTTSPNGTTTGSSTTYSWMKAGVHHFLLTIGVYGDVTTPGMAYSITSYLAKPAEPTGLNEQSLLNSQVQIYPNPASNNLNITTGSLRMDHMTLYNMIGQKLWDEALGGSSAVKVALADINAGTGTYFLKIATDKGVVTKQVTVR